MASSTSLSEHTVTYQDGKELFYYASGPLEGPLVILVHGWPATAKTWYHQIPCLASLGFRVLAPDMPGYGKSTAREVVEDYSQESIVAAMLALIDDTGRDDAVWIGHDWGAGCVWSFAAHHPNRCRAVANMAVPYHIVEIGLDQGVKYANRIIYPADKYRYAQFSYQAYHEQEPEKGLKFMNGNIPSFIKLLYSKPKATKFAQPAMTATTMEDDGWLGGSSKVTSLPPPEAFPDADSLLEPTVLAEMTETFVEKGFFGPNAYYRNSARNRVYNMPPTVDPELHMPVLFIEARFDSVCDTAVSRIAEPQRRLCKRLTEASIDCGHWVQLEKPMEVNAILTRWLATEVSTFWPGFWVNKLTKNY
ncbi:Alpha/Beta hydrolase protein [Xylariales sp. PMI_506]|nr:Alpha/Beta hydrolase protein [Xylariales sp. PMI_506]